MTAALGFALLSLAAAGFLDVSFKRYSRKDRSRGMYACGCGVVWAVLQLGLFAARDVSPSLDAASLAYGIAAGALLAAANILLIESLTHLDIGLGSTIYRLNTIGVVLLSILVLGESVGALKLAGVLAGLAAICLLYASRPPAADLTTFGVFLAVAVFASLCRAIFGVVWKAGLNAGADANALLLLSASSWVAMGLLYAALRERRLRVTPQKLGYATLSGTLLFVVTNGLIEAIKLGEVSLLAPIANLSFIVALLISVAFGMEALTVRKSSAVACAVLSIFLLAQGL